MKIIISYSSSWENSFLDGTIESHFNQNRSYIGSSQQGFEKYKDISITKTTVLGMLNRLIGEQRRLFQAQKDPDYFFKDIEEKVFFEETKDFTNEIVFLRNLNESYDRGLLCGVKVSETNELFSDKYKDRFWGILLYSVDDLLDFLKNGKEKEKKFEYCDRFKIGELINSFTQKNKTLTGEKIKLTQEQLEKAELILKSVSFLNEDELTKILAGIDYKTLIYCSFYKMTEILITEDPSFKNNLTKNGGISGISKRGFTLKDFLKGSGDKKRIIGNPSFYSDFVKEDGKTVKKNYYLKKKSGKIRITIDVNKETALKIKEMIENAAVHSFVVGKKGLAFVENIII